MSPIDSDANADSDSDQVMGSLMEWFSGDFDNYRQVLEDRRLGLHPKEGGGHEHFHCTLIPVNTTTRLAAFYFDGNPQRIFRFRFYKIVEVVESTGGNSSSSSSSSSTNTSKSIEMHLYTLHPDLEKILRSNADEPSTWPTLFEEFDPVSSSATELPKVSILPKCEISWSTQKDPTQHSYIEKFQEDSLLGSASTKLSPIHAVMVYGEAIVNSTIIPGMMIRIVDQLSLFEDTFYINDRGFDPTSGDYIYGNQRDIPYVLQRVSRFVPCKSLDNNGTGPAATVQQTYDREIVDADIEWTLGPRWRTEEEYDQKILSIGGPSIGIKRSVNKK